MGKTVSFKRPDGKDVSGYLAEPAGGKGPGIVVIMPMAARRRQRNSGGRWSRPETESTSLSRGSHGRSRGTMCSSAWTS